jgi:hypothetical protein
LKIKGLHGSANGNRTRWQPALAGSSRSIWRVFSAGCMAELAQHPPQTAVVLLECCPIRFSGRARNHPTTMQRWCQARRRTPVRSRETQPCCSPAKTKTGPRSRTGAPPARRRRQVVGRAPTCRRGRASGVSANCVDIATVSERLGHSSVATTAAIYSHAIRGEGRAAAQVWDDLMQQSRGEKPTGREGPTTTRV